MGQPLPSVHTNMLLVTRQHFGQYTPTCYPLDAPCLGIDAPCLGIDSPCPFHPYDTRACLLLLDELECADTLANHTLGFLATRLGTLQLGGMRLHETGQGPRVQRPAATASSNRRWQQAMATGDGNRRWQQAMAARGTSRSCCSDLSTSSRLSFPSSSRSMKHV